MDKENTLKIILTGALGVFCSYFGVLVVPLIIMLVFMIIDYITGMAKAYINSELNSKQGVIGILKKLGYLFIVISGMAVDYLLSSVLTQTGIDLPDNFTVALLVIVWFILNEIISILENLAIMGVPMPKFLINLVQKLKVVAEKSEVDE